jgi:hypothetical protein
MLVLPIGVSSIGIAARGRRGVRYRLRCPFLITPYGGLNCEVGYKFFSYVSTPVDISQRQLCCRLLL